MVSKSKGGMLWMGRLIGGKTPFEIWTEPESLTLITGWCREGFTNEMLAERMGISQKTFYRWCEKSEKLKEAIKQGKEVADYMVENALFKSAIGFEHTETKTYISGQQDKQGNRTVRVEKTVKYYPPNVTAIAIWLNNRKPDQWKRNRDNSVDISSEDSNITVNIIKNSEAKKQEKEEHERRKREGIKEETVKEDEFKEYQNGYRNECEKEEQEEYEEMGKKVGIEEADEDDWSDVEGYDPEDDEWDE